MRKQIHIPRDFSVDSVTVLFLLSFIDLPLGMTEKANREQMLEEEKTISSKVVKDGCVCKTIISPSLNYPSRVENNILLSTPKYVLPTIHINIF